MNGKHVLLTVFIFTLMVSSCVGCLGFFEGYTEKGQEMTSAEYSVEQYKFFIDKYNAVRQAGSNIVSVENDMERFEEMHPNPSLWTSYEMDSYEALVNQRRAYISQYNRLVRDYNSRMRDLTTNQDWMKPQNFPSSLPLYSDDMNRSAMLTNSDEPLTPPEK